MSEKLAIEGGTPVRDKPLPHTGMPEGRDLGQEEEGLLREVIRSGYLNRYGGCRMVVRFEEETAALYGVPHAVATTSGTASLHTAVAAVNPEPGDEIVTTPLTDMGTIIAIVMQQCIPVFADVDPDTGNITAETIAAKITEKTRAVIVVHLFGGPADMAPILDMARDRGLAVIEDCAQAHLAEYRGRKVGTLGDIGCFSLQQSKQITAGDGGMLITSDDALFDRAALFAGKGWPRSSDDAPRGYSFLGINYRMNELTGAVALAQIRKAPAIVERRRASADWLARKLAQIDGVNPPAILPDCRSSWWKFGFKIDGGVLAVSPADFAAAMRAEGISTGCGYIAKPIFDYPSIRDRITFGASRLPWSLPQARKDVCYDVADLPGTARALSEMLVINWSEGISMQDAEDIYRAIVKVAEHYRR